MKYYLLLLTCLLFAGCTQGKGPHTDFSNSGDYVNHCIGRYQFSLPSEFVLVPGGVGEFRPQPMSNQESAINFELAAINVGPTDFEHRVQNRIDELREETKDSGVDYLADSRTLSKSIVQIRVGNVDTFHRSEIHAMKGKAYVIASLESSDNQFEAAEARLRKFVDGIAVADDVSKAEGGFCIGPLIIHGDFKREWFPFSYRSSSRPDLVVFADVDTFSKDDPETLFDRLGGPSSLLNIFDLKHSVVRKREISVAGIRAQEWLGAVRLPDQNDKKFGFALETMRKNPSLLAPRIHVNLNSGENGLDGIEHKTSISESEAVLMWDNIVASIHPR